MFDNPGIDITTVRSTTKYAHETAVKIVQGIKEEIQESRKSGENTEDQATMLSALAEHVFGNFVMVAAEAQEANFDPDEFIRATTWVTALIHTQLIFAISDGGDRVEELCLFTRIREENADAMARMMDAINKQRAKQRASQ